MNFDDFKALVGLSVRDPQAAAHRLMGQGWPMQARWMALLAAVSVSGVLASVAAMLFSAPDPEGTQVMMLSRQPIVLAAMLLFFGNLWTANLLYVGLALMIGVSISAPRETFTMRKPGFMAASSASVWWARAAARRLKYHVLVRPATSATASAAQEKSLR